MKLPKPNEFELAPAGTHVATCVQFVDLGSHENTYQGQSKGMRREVRIAWELPEESMRDGRPFLISKRYTWSMGEKSSLRKHLESWRGRKFDENDFGNFDIRNILGKPCLLSIKHDERNGNTYAHIDSVSPLMKNMTPPAQIGAQLYFSLDEFSQTTFDGLSEKTREYIAQSPEYRAIASGKTAQSAAPVNSGAVDLDDEVPF